MTSLETCDIEGTLIYKAPILPAAPPPSPAALRAMEAAASTRRRAEIAATYRIISDIFGTDTLIGHDMTGAPYMEGYPCGHISISHCTDMVVVAVNPNKTIGIDIELWRPKLRNVTERFLTDDEKRRITSPGELLQAWTVKEAVYKAAMTPGLPLHDIHLPAPGSSLARAIGPEGERWFNVRAVVSTPLRAITLVTL